MRHTRTGKITRAVGEKHIHLTYRGMSPRNWRLDIYHAVTVDGDKFAGDWFDTSRHDTKALAQATADAFERLTSNYAPHEHGGRSRHTEAILIAYAEGSAK